MNKIFFILLLTCLLFFSCASDGSSSEAVDNELPETVEQIPEETAETEQTEPAMQLIIEEEPDIVIMEEPVIEESYSEEYLRSTSSLSNEDAVIVPPKVFEEDKNQIFLIINDLDRIMKTKDFDSWISYLNPDSYDYWANRHNLQELSRNLIPLGGKQINNIREYFETFFIPARRGRIVDEIRYVTPTHVKVVQYKNKTDIIYYFFDKIDGEWKLTLDTL